MKTLVAWLCTIVAASAAAQTSAPAPPATGFILGRVVDGTTGKPIAGVTVTLAPPPPQSSGSTSPRALTSGDGYFLFAGLPRGGYTITATKGGYVPGASGKLQPTGTGQPLELADSDRHVDLTIPIWRYGSISGTVVDEAGEPLVGIQVRVMRRIISGGASRLSLVSTIATDDRGAYRAGLLVPGDYTVAVVTTVATIPTTLQEAYTNGIATGSISPYQAGLDAGAGSALSTPGGVRIGEFLLKGSGSAVNGPAAEAPNIQPPLADGRLFVYPTLYHPGESRATQATVIPVAAGEDRVNIDFQERPVLSSRISGMVVGPNGPSTNTQVMLLAAGTESLSRDAGFESAATITDGAGRFTFLGVTPGEYTLRVLQAPARPVTTSSNASITVQVGNSTITSVVAGPPPPIPNLPTFSASMPIAVAEREISGLVVSLHEGARLGGRVDFVGAAARPTAEQLQRIFVNIDAADGRTVGPAAVTQLWQAQVDANGQLMSYELPPGKYVLRATAPPGWKFTGATLDGKDATDTPFELGTMDVSPFVLTFSDRQADVAGTVRDDTRAPSAVADVVLFPADPRAWTGYGTVARRIRSTSAGRDGTFTITGVPAGDYYLAAIPSGGLPDWQNPSSLQRLVAQAVALTVNASDKTMQDLVVRPVK